MLSLIPVVGSVISAILITLLGLTISPTVALVCLVYYLAYQQLEAYVIYPRIMERTVDVPDRSPSSRPSRAPPCSVSSARCWRCRWPRPS